MSYFIASGVNNDIPLANEANYSHFAGALGAERFYRDRGYLK